MKLTAATPEILQDTYHDLIPISKAMGFEVVSYDGSKTVPGGDDDPADPSGVFPVDGEITVEVAAVGAGTAWVVAYENGGASTFLEIDEDGEPIEPHGVGGALTVTD